jgi:5,6-dimethylbenzimidazole synthase
VSILRNDALADIFGIPDDVIPVAYLCVGYVRDFPDRPVLASAAWAERLPPRRVVHFDTWTGEDAHANSLNDKIEDPSIWLAVFPDDAPSRR